MLTKMEPPPSLNDPLNLRRLDDAERDLVVEMRLENETDRISLQGKLLVCHTLLSF